MTRDTGTLHDFVPRRRLYVLPQWKTVYVSVPKNACTSLKWPVAELAGEDLDRLRKGGLSFSPTRAGQIHQRDAWRVAPRMTQLDRELVEGILPESGWFVFAVVRDPRLRLFSAWQDKYLLRSPGYWRSWEGPDAPAVPRTPADVVDSFASFVQQIDGNPEHPALDDGHFTSQVRALREDVVPYSRVYDMSELGELMAQWQEHLRGQGYEGTLRLGRSNRSPFDARAAVLTDDVCRAIERVYAVDFERFGDRWDLSPVLAKQETWGPDAFAHAHAVIDTNERIADLVREARRLRRRLGRSKRPGTGGRLLAGPSLET